MSVLYIGSLTTRCSLVVAACQRHASSSSRPCVPYSVLPISRSYSSTNPLSPPLFLFLFFCSFLSLSHFSLTFFSLTTSVPWPMPSFLKLPFVRGRSYLLYLFLPRATSCRFLALQLLITHRLTLPSFAHSTPPTFLTSLAAEVASKRLALVRLYPLFP